MIAIMVSGLAFVGCIHFGRAQSGTNVTGIITSDMTWTKTNSPYSLIGPVGVATGVTLAIQAGVTVDLNSYYLQVNGTLSAIGTSTDPIYISDGGVPYGISFTSSSSGSIIENAVINSATPPAIDIVNASPQIISNVINGVIEVDKGGSPVISNNVITGQLTVTGSPVISNNVINGGSGVLFSGTPTIIAGGSSLVSNNTIKGDGEPAGIYTNSNPTIADNIISNFSTGIRAYYSATIESNLIINNGIGIDVGLGTNLIQNNTIAYNSIGINSPKSSSTIIYNNIQNNSNYNIYLDVYSANNVTAAYNWWGTTDIALVNQTFNYRWSGFDLVVVNFLPFLTSLNPEAPPIPLPSPSPTSTQSPSPSTTTTSTSTPTSSPSPSSSSSQAEANTSYSLPIELIAAGIIALVIVGVAIGAFLLGKRAERNSTRSVDYQI